MDWVARQQQKERELRDLFQAAAEGVLYPRKARVLWDCDLEGSASGMLTKSMAGMYIIQISEGLPYDQAYGIFLHELGHALDDGIGHRIRPSGAHMNPKVKVKISPVESLARPRLESTADAIAAKLASWAESRAYDFLDYDNNVLTAKLKALATYHRST
jgi:hypothetical protein